ncbi:DUF4007 family protein [bacterium]|nr:MAG: DUF4007 family protein [bacterium]
MSQILANNIKYTFSGHESFHCRQLWLKKGYDYLNNGKSFNDPDAVVTLGVGKNMVTSIKFWMKAFNLIDTGEQLTSFANFLFSSNGFDPYLEDDQSLWLLHYELIKNNFSSIYHLIFNVLRKEKMQFTKENFQSFVGRIFENVNVKTIGDDFDVFKKMYLNKSEDNKLSEDSFLGLLSDLQLLKLYEKGVYFIDQAERPSLSPEVLLYTILDTHPYSSSISLHTLENDENSAGNIFAINRQDLLDKVEQLIDKYEWITYNDQAGIKEIQFKEKPINNFSLFI